MPRPVTLFTGQWADLPFEEMCRLASSWGYDGLEIACWGDHFEVDRALNEPGYIEGRHAILKKYNLNGLSTRRDREEESYKLSKKTPKI